MSDDEEVVAPLIIPTGPLNEAELRQWRSRVYRRCEEPLIRQFFHRYCPTVFLPDESDWFWCYIYTAVRIMTRNLVSNETIRSGERPAKDDFESLAEDLLSVDGLAYRAQIWLDRHGVNAATYKGTFTRNQLVYTLPKELYAQLAPIPHPRINTAVAPSMEVQQTANTGIAPPTGLEEKNQ